MEEKKKLLKPVWSVKRSVRSVWVKQMRHT